MEYQGWEIPACYSGLREEYQAESVAALLESLRQHTPDAVRPVLTTLIRDRDHAAANRLTALALLAQAAARLKAARTWEFLAALVRQANETEPSWGVDLMFEVQYSYPNGSASLFFPEEPLGLDDTFAAAARLDFGHALMEARPLQDELTRALVMVEVARVALVMGGRDGKAR